LKRVSKIAVGDTAEDSLGCVLEAPHTCGSYREELCDVVCVMVRRALESAEVRQRLAQRAARRIRAARAS